MKKFKTMQITLVTICMMTFLLAGCGSASSKTQSQGQTQNGKSRGRGSFNLSAMKTRYETALKELVSNRTITQAQSDKVLAALTVNVPKNTQGGTKNSQQNNQNKSQGNWQNRSRYNPLSSLVSSGVITQAQSDTIMQKIRGNRQNIQNQQNTQSTQNN